MEWDIAKHFFHNSWRYILKSVSGRKLTSESKEFTSEFEKVMNLEYIISTQETI